MADFPAVVSITDLDGTNGFKIVGADAGEGSGVSVASAGDINGDGIADLIIGSDTADRDDHAQSGAAYVVFGQSGGFSATLDLANINGRNGFQLTGAAENDHAGRAVSAAGDVNGDGLDDLLVGAPYTSNNGLFFSGTAYIIYGKSAGFAASTSLSNISAATGSKISGSTNFGGLGASLSNLGDVNGDGRDDFIIGAPGDATGGSSAGAAYVVYGKASGYPSMLTASSISGSTGFKIIGADQYDYAGTAVSSAGDFNGDGIADILVGAYGADLNDRDGNGAAYVVLGKRSGRSDIVDLGSTEVFKIEGDPSAHFTPASGDKHGEEAGYSVASAGDVNGDGFDDIVIGAPESQIAPDYNTVGSAYVVFGSSKSTGKLHLADLNGSNGFRITSGSSGGASERLGTTVSSAGDVNGDGYDDVLIGIENNGDGYGACVVFGRASGFSTSINPATLNGSNGFRIQSGAITTVSAAGDINDDGFDDLIIANSGAATTDGNGAGTSYVIYGRGSPSSHSPSDIKISASTVAEFARNGTVIGTLSTTDADANDSFTYTLLDNVNGRFSLIGSTLKIANGLLLDYEQAKSDTVTVRVTDDQGHTFDKALIISIRDVNPETVNGSSSTDTFVGGAGADKLYGLAGNDKLTGGAGNDLLDGGTGFDILTGNAGDDIYLVDSVADKIVESAGSAFGSDTIKASISYTLGTNIESLVLTGSVGLNGTGNTLANTITGNAGANVIDGKAGLDILKGGSGADTFVFSTTLNASTNLDHIVDFSAAADTIQVSKVIFKALTADGDTHVLTQSEFKDVTKAGTTLDADDHILYDKSSGTLSYDADGSGATKAVQFAVIDNHTALTFQDFYVV